MNKNSLSRQDNIARDLVRGLMIALALTIFSATAIANNQRPVKINSSALAAPTLQPTKSPTSQRLGSSDGAPQTLTRSQLPSAPAIPGQTQVDTYTVALYHLDSQVGSLVPDATGNFTGTLVNNALVTPNGLYGGALLLDGNGSYLKIGNLGSLPQGTIEAFVDFSQTCVNGTDTLFTIFSIGGDYHTNNRVFNVRSNEWLDAEIIIGTPSIASSGINPCRYLNVPAATFWPYETWRFHHVAATWGPRGTEIWVDGVLHGIGSNWIVPQHTPVPSGSVTRISYGGPYWCNPQSQGAYLYNTGTPPNPVYPLCQTPVIAPPYPTGDYTGTLPAYTNIIIGCDTDTDPSILCFKGRIDEVRISNIQRQFSPSVDPTSTPTPTQTPDVINGAYAVDAYTLELYHLDSQAGGVTYAVSNRPAWLMSSGTTIVPGGRFGSGVSFDGLAGSFVNLGNLNNPSESKGVVEGWVKLNNATNVEIVTGGAGYYPDSIQASNVRLGVDTTYGNTVQFGVKDSTGVWHWANSGVSPAAFVGAWHHIAGTFGPRGLEIWVDGKLCGTDTYTGFTGQNGAAYLIGCDAQHNCMTGMVDEVRLSNIQRSFTFSNSPFRPSNLNPYSPSTGFQLFLPMIFKSMPGLCGVSSSAPVQIQSIP